MSLEELFRISDSNSASLALKKWMKKKRVVSDFFEDYILV